MIKIVAYKTSPGSQKDYLYQKGNYRPASISGPATQAGSDNLDEIVQASGIRVIFQKTPDRFNQGRKYDLSQPVWFYRIMEMLAGDDGEKKETSNPGQSYASLN